jgi:hypothetical protein
MIKWRRRSHRRECYRVGDAEHCDIADAEFDLAVSYVALVDVADLARPCARPIISPRSLRRVCNLSPMVTAILGRDDQAQLTCLTITSTFRRADADAADGAQHSPDIRPTSTRFSTPLCVDQTEPKSVGGTTPASR